MSIADELKNLDLDAFRAVFEDIDSEVERIAEEVWKARGNSSHYYEAGTMQWGPEDDVLDALTWHVSASSTYCGCNDWDGNIVVSLRDVVEGVDLDAIRAETAEKDRVAAEAAAAKEAAKKVAKERRAAVLAELTPEQRAALGE